MRTNTNTTPTRKTEGLGNTKNPTLATSTHTPKGVSPRYSDLLGCMKYNRDGGMNTPDNAWHDEHFYCEAVEVVVERDGKTVGLGMNPYEWFCYSVAKKWLLSRDWLPDSAGSASQREEHRAVVSETLFECLANGESAEEIVGKCYKALDKSIGDRKQDTHKTLPREEYEWKAQRAFTATLFTADLSTVGGTEADLDPDSEYGGFTLEESEKMARLVELFNAVKEAHKFATPEKWLCAQCYALNMPTEVAIERVYGEAIKVASAKSQKALDKAVNSCRVKYSRHANEVFGWILDEVEKSPEGLDKWVAVLNRCKATAEATVTLEECAVKFSLNDEVVKFLRSRLNATPESVLRYCEAVRAGATA